MKKRLLFTLLFGFAALTYAQKVLYSPQDSVKVETLLQQRLQKKSMKCTMLYFASQLLGTPYVAKTLEIDGDKHLIVNLHALDCTTFVENLVALSQTIEQGKTSFQAFARNLNHLRYRDGVRVGYVSRLHYFSDWVKNNTKKGCVKEQTEKISSVTLSVTLDFMSTHAEKYPLLKGAPGEVAKIKKIEAEWQAYDMPYIPQECLKDVTVLEQIKEGDIIGLVCDYKGLDVSHLGIACWKNGALHLLDASMSGGKVQIESENIYNYVAKRKHFKGIRVVRIINKN